MLNLIFIYNLMGACNTINVKENISSNLIEKNKKFSDFIVPKNLVSKGKIQNKYIITEEFLGRGASGIVSLAKDKTGKKQYAIKTINKLQIHNIDFVKTHSFFHNSEVTWYGKTNHFSLLNSCAPAVRLCLC